MQVRKQLLELDVEQQTGSKSEKEYIKAVYYHPAYLTYMQSTSWETLGWRKNKLESRLLGEIPITSDMQMTPPVGSHYGRSRPWRGHEENIWQARPSGTPSMMTSWWGHEEKTWQTRPSRIRDPPGWPRPLPHPVSSPLFCCCSCLPCCGFLCCLPRVLLLLFHWIKTNLKPWLINLLDAGTLWRGQGWRKCFSSNPFAGILACLINVCSHCKKCSWLF